MITYDIYKEATRTIYSYLHKPISIKKTFNPNHPLPHSAIAILNPESEAAIPWGDHPNDNDFGQMCQSCYRKDYMTEGNGEQHTHEETQRDEHTNEDGSRVETEKTEKVEVEQKEEE